MNIKRYTSVLLGKAMLLIFFISLFSSCSESKLEETPIDFISTSNAFNSPKDVEMGIAGLYSLERNWFSNVNEKHMFVLIALGTDEGYYGEDPGGGSMSNWDTEIVPTGSFPGTYWTKAYNMIQQCNVLLEGINKVLWNDEVKKNKCIAEAKFFRAFNYRILVTLFGDVPLQITAVKTAKTNFIRAPKTEVFAQIEEDLNFAAINLPVRGKEDEPGKLTQGAAWNLLSEIYLSQNKFQDAVDAASHVIKDYGYGLMKSRFGNQRNIFKTENVYYDLFAEGNQNLSANTEAIWVIQNDPEITGGGFYAGERAFGPAYYRLGNAPDGKKAIIGELYGTTYTGYSDTLGRPVAWCRPTNYTAYKIWASDWTNDYRNSEACIKRNYYFNNPASKYNGMKISWNLYTSRSSQLADTTQYLYPYYMKAAAPLSHYTDLSRSGGGVNHKDIYAMRLAETYLLRAEAYLGLNQKDKAAADINEVRTRSKANPISDGEVTLDYILDERARELYTEEWRMLTLMRMGKLVERVRMYNDNPKNPGISIKDHHNLWPIPQSAIDLNTGATMEQNPGY